MIILACSVLFCHGLRLPTPDQPLDLDKYKNASGFSWSIMTDLQRIFLSIDIAQKSVEKPVDMQYLSAVTGAKTFSSKISLVMGSQAEWRRGQGWLWACSFSFCLWPC